MQTEVVNVKRSEFDVFIGRDGHGFDGYFGNPFKLQYGEPRGSTIEKYREWFNFKIQNDRIFRGKVMLLKGKRLGCFCKPHACHGDVIVEYLNNLEDE